MLHTRIYSSQAPSTQKALLDIGVDYRRDGFDADVALIFASIHHASHGEDLNHALKDILGDIPFLGWLGTSVYHSNIIPEWQPALVIMLLSGVEAHVSSAMMNPLGAHIGVSLLADSPTGAHRFLSVTHDATDFKGLLNTLDEQSVPLTGVVSLSPKNMESLLICSSTDNDDKRCAGMLSLSNIKMVWQVAHGTQLLGAKHQITEATNHLLYEIDGRPALEVLLDDLPPSLHDSLPQLGGRLFVGLATPDGDEWLMRPVSGIDPNQGALMIPEQCQDHEELAFFIQDLQAAQSNIQEAVKNLKTNLGNQTPGALILFNCTSRDEKTMGEALFDLKTIQNAFPKKIPITGIAGGGELTTIGRQSHLFQYCSVIVALLEDNTHA